MQAPDELHGHEMAVFGQAGVEHRHDIRMIERGGDPGLPQEALDHQRIRPRPQELERHVPPEPVVVRPVHHAHAALAEDVEDAVVRDDLRVHTLARMLHGGRSEAISASTTWRRHVQRAAHEAG